MASSSLRGAVIVGDAEDPDQPVIGGDRDQAVALS
jgi:hypothetical protein